MRTHGSSCLPCWSKTKNRTTTKKPKEYDAVPTYEQSSCAPKAGVPKTDEEEKKKKEPEGAVQHCWAKPMKWLGVMIVVGLVIVFAVMFHKGGSQPPPQPPVVQSNCNRHVKELLQTRQGAIEEQNKQMQERQGAPQGQSKPAQKWEEAVQTIAAVGHLRANLKSLKDTAEKASNQIQNWSPVPGGSTRQWVKITARAVVASQNLETDFEGWCETQHTTFNALAKLLEKKVVSHGNVMNIAVENKMLQRIMITTLEGLQNMKTKLEGLQADLTKMPACALHMGVEACLKKGSNKHWAKGFTEQIAIAQDLTGRASLFANRFSNDYANMKDVLNHLDISNSIEDAHPFQTKVLPQLRQLLNLLDNHGENVGTE